MSEIVQVLLELTVSNAHHRHEHSKLYIFLLRSAKLSATIRDVVNVQSIMPSSSDNDVANWLDAITRLSA